MSDTHITENNKDAHGYRVPETVLKLYTGIRVDVTEAGHPPVEPPDPDTPDPAGEGRCAAYRDAVLASISTAAPEKDTTGQFRYDLRDLEPFRGLARNITSMTHTVEAVQGKLFGVTICRSKEPLTPAELSLVKGYCLYLYDKNVLHFELSCPASDFHEKLSVHIRQSEDHTTFTEKGMEQALWHKTKEHKKGGDAR